MAARLPLQIALLVPTAALHIHSRPPTLLSPAHHPTRSPSPTLSASDLPPPQAPAGFEPPEPKPLSVPEGAVLTTLTGSLALALRLGTGALVLGWRPGLASNAPGADYALFGFRDTSAVLPSCSRPEVPLRLYEYEPSPYCRKVREACSLLALNVTLLPCPGARKGFAGDLEAAGGKMMVPYLEDPNTGEAMYESDDIIDYLFNTYGPGADAVPWLLRGPFAFWTTAFASLARGLAGNGLDPSARPDNTRMKPIELWGYEGSPFVKPVRERLCELALPHTMVFCPRGSEARDLLVRKTGGFQVPFVSDPNTGVEMFESDRIVEYLNRVYRVPS